MLDLHYLTESYDEKIRRIKEIAAPLNFIFFTDAHNRLSQFAAGTSGTPYEIPVNAVLSMQYILERCPEISFLVCGGDSGNDYNPDPDKMREAFHEIMDALYSLPIPVHCCIGNHDDGIGNAIDNGWDTVKAAILPDEMHALCMKYNPTEKNYYYIDMQVEGYANGWRMVFLNTSDKPYYLDNGRYTHGWCNEVSHEQSEWFEREALNTDRNIIVFSHAPLTNKGVFGSEGMPWGIKPYDDLRGGPRLFHAAKSCRNVKLSVAGHVHYDNVLYYDGLCSVTSLSAFGHRWAESVPDRVPGTYTETAFDVFSIKENVLYITRFGAGEDRRATLLRL